jgi:hypothetical protein
MPQAGYRYHLLLEAPASKGRNGGSPGGDLRDERRRRYP